MNPSFIATFVLDLLVVLAAGLVSGAVCKRIGVSMVVGYLVIGCVIGQGGLGLLSGENHEIEYLSSAGALLLLYSIGIEFSPGELFHLGRYFLVGGSVQMVLVAVPVIVAGIAFGMEPRTAILIGAAVSLSSTVMVFKSLEEWGQVGSRHGRRAIGILLFQDVAIVPLMLLVPMLTVESEHPGIMAWLLLASKSILFVGAVLIVRFAVRRWGVRFLHRLASVELVVLSALIVLCGACLGAHAVGLPPALGALAAGIILSGNRLTGQFDALMLPFRETFAAVFFVGLGTMMHFDVLFDTPVAVIGGFLGVLALKSVAAAVALRLVGLRWLAAFGMGLGLAQLGELSFILLLEGTNSQPPVIATGTYDYVLLLSLGTLILTPQLLRRGLSWAGKATDDAEVSPEQSHRTGKSSPQAVVIGSGPIGGRVASYLETTGIDVCLVELNPVNLHAFAQQGFRTVAGDAREPEILHHAGIEESRLAVVTVPEDEVAMKVVTTIRALNPTCTILVRCRWQSSMPIFERVGVDAVVSEEVEVGGSLVQWLERFADREGRQSKK